MSLNVSPQVAAAAASTRTEAEVRRARAPWMGKTFFEHRIQTEGGPAVLVVLSDPTIESLAQFFDVPEDQVQIIEDDDGEEYVIVSSKGEGVISTRPESAAREHVVREGAE